MVERAARVAPQSFLAYRGFRHLKLTIALLAAALAVYVVHDPVGGRNGGTWVGYTLGGISAGLIGWLMWYGVRKRSYFSSGASLKGWLSAHFYLGLSLLLLVPLHSGFQFGWNIHTLAYALMSFVILSGVVGIVMYVRVPDLMTENRRGQRIDSLFGQVADLDSECEAVARGLPDHYAKAAQVAITETMIGGSLRRQLSGNDPNCGTTRAIQQIKGHKETLGEQTRTGVARLLELLGRKAALLVRIRRDVRYQALTEAWLLLHVPLSFATLAAVGTHIFVVFYYW